MYATEDSEPNPFLAPENLPPMPVRRPRNRWTLFCIAIGVLCALGVGLAVVDPSLTGHASGPGLGVPESASANDDNGFVPPPVARAKAEPRKSPEELAEQRAREAHADELIQKMLVKLRAEREARAAARKAGHSTD